MGYNLVALFKDSVRSGDGSVGDTQGRVQIFVDDFVGATDVDRGNLVMGEVTGTITGRLGPTTEGL